MSVDKGWLTVGQAAKRLGVSEQSVRDYGKAGKLTVGRTPGGHRRISPDSVERLRGEMYPPEPDSEQTGQAGSGMQVDGRAGSMQPPAADA